MVDARAQMLPFSASTAWVLAAVMIASAPLIEWAGDPEPGLHAYTLAALVLAPALGVAALISRRPGGTRPAQALVLVASFATSFIVALAEPDPIPGALLRPVAALPMWVAAALVPFPALVAGLAAATIAVTAWLGWGASGLGAQIVANFTAGALAVALSYGWRRGRLAVLEADLLGQRLSHKEVERAAIGRFVRHAAHQLRTPLTPLRMVPGSLRRHAGDPAKVEKDVQDLERQIARFTDTVERLTTLAAVEREGATSASDLADRVRAAAAHDERISVEAPFDAYVPLPGAAVTTLVQELVANALHAASARVSCRVAKDGPDWRMDIEDDGTGIPSSQRQQLMEPFGRVAVEGTSATGTGLGFALVDAVVQAAGGRLEMADSALGGLRVSVWLPDAAAVADR